MFRKKLTTLDRRPKLYLNTVVEKGRGVFCYDDIKAGEVLEVTPVLIFDEENTKRLATTILENYCFSAQALPDSYLARFGIQSAQDAVCLIMGMTSYCNHLSVPNAKTEFIIEGLSALCVLTAVKDIPKETEICVNYGIAWFGTRKPADVARRKAALEAAEAAAQAPLEENADKSTGPETAED